MKGNRTAQITAIFALVGLVVAVFAPLMVVFGSF